MNNKTNNLAFDDGCYWFFYLQSQIFESLTSLTLKQMKMKYLGSKKYSLILVDLTTYKRLSDFSKGQLHGQAEIFKGLKMTFRTKILKKNYTTLISIKNTTNFVLTTFL